MQRYNPTEIEKKWQEQWEKDGTYTVDLSDTSKPKYYGFSMLPGITGAGIHIGHGRTFQFSDIKVRAKRQQGYNAYSPIGWDSFGLPVENYAIKIGKKPREAHDEAKENFITQLKRLGYSYDWSKEISTADPAYYKWTQWIFNKLYEHGLAYQKEQPQWWCETDQTVLANEQVEGGKCWRCGNTVTKKNLKQWFFKITEYADEILEATDDLNWTEMVKTMQKNWIGRSVGAEVDFALADTESQDKIKVFTTRPDTLFGATFMVLAPEHPLVKTITTPDQKVAVEAYVQQANTKSEIERQDTNREKTGLFTGAYAINPVNGEEIPVWIADYVLTGYGTGAIMAVPAHDERDFAFAKTFDLPVVRVIKNDAPDSECTHDEGIVMNSGTYDGIPSGEAREKIVADLEKQGVATEKVNYKMRDWLISRQRYWGAPIPMVHCAQCVDESQYTIAAIIEFKDSNNFKLLNIGTKTAITRAKDDVETPKYSRLKSGDVVQLIDNLSGQKLYARISSATTYANLGDLFADKEVLRSSFAKDFGSADELRQHYESNRPGYTQKIDQNGVFAWRIEVLTTAMPVPDDQLPVVLPGVDDYKPKGGGATSVLATVEDWVNTSCPKCGGPAKRETDTMDGYACSSWYFLRYIDPFNSEQAWDPEAMKQWMPVDFYNGADHAVAHLLYARFWMRFFHKLGLVPTPEPFDRMMYNAYIMAADGLKMSKSKGNVIDPLEIMDSGYGADSLRVYEMFIAPYDMEAPWDTRGVPGAYRFLNRTWTLTQEYMQNEAVTLDEVAEKDILSVAHKTIKKVTEDIEHDKFNTAVSAMMEAVNAYYKLKEQYGIGASPAWQFAIESLLQVLAPFAPHITEELWHQLGHKDTIHIDTWPSWDEAYLHANTITVVVQVNGKLRATLELPTDIDKDAAIAAAQANEKVASYLHQKEVRKTIYVPQKLVNFVV